MTTHLIIPDTQVKPGVPINHLLWAGKYIVDKRPDKIIHLGDHWDFPSLSSYDTRKKREFHSRSLIADIKAGNKALELLLSPLQSLHERQRADKKRLYKPDLYLLEGNHEARLNRAQEESPETLHGILDILPLTHGDFRVVPFLEPLYLDGVTYSHYFYNPNTSRPYSGAADTMLKNIGFTFTMGHQQGKKQAERHLANKAVQRGLIVGSFYQHDEEYKGPQGNSHFRGLVVKHEVKNGDYMLNEVSMDFLKRKYGKGERMIYA